MTIVGVLGRGGDGACASVRRPAPTAGERCGCCGCAHLRASGRGRSFDWTVSCYRRCVLAPCVKPWHARARCAHKVGGRRRAWSTRPRRRARRPRRSGKACAAISQGQARLCGACVTQAVWSVTSTAGHQSSAHSPITLAQRVTPGPLFGVRSGTERNGSTCIITSKSHSSRRPEWRGPAQPISTPRPVNASARLRQHHLQQLVQLAAARGHGRGCCLRSARLCGWAEPAAAVQIRSRHAVTSNSGGWHGGAAGAVGRTANTAAALQPALRSTRSTQQHPCARVTPPYHARERAPRHSRGSV